MLSLNNADPNVLKKSISNLQSLAARVRELKENLELDLMQQCICDESLYIKQIPHVASANS